MDRARPPQRPRPLAGEGPTSHDPRAAPQHVPHTVPHRTYPPSQYPVPGVKAIATPDGQALAGLGFRLLARIVDGLLLDAHRGRRGLVVAADDDTPLQPGAGRGGRATGDTSAMSASSRTARSAAPRRRPGRWSCWPSAPPTRSSPSASPGQLPASCCSGCGCADWERPGLPALGPGGHALAGQRPARTGPAAVVPARLPLAVLGPAQARPCTTRWAAPSSCGALGADDPGRLTRRGGPRPGRRPRRAAAPARARPSRARSPRSAPAARWCGTPRPPRPARWPARSGRWRSPRRGPR